MINSCYNGNHIKALISAFPDVRFDPTNFINIPRMFILWNTQFIVFIFNF